MENCFYFVTFVSILTALLKTTMGNEGCIITKRDFQHGKKSYNGTILKQVGPIGIQMCLTACKNTGGCTYINYNRCDLNCDLMDDDADKEPMELTPSDHMIYGSLGHQVKVGRFQSVFKVTCTSALKC